LLLSEKNGKNHELRIPHNSVREKGPFSGIAKGGAMTKDIYRQLGNRREIMKRGHDIRHAAFLCILMVLFAAVYVAGFPAIALTQEVAEEPKSGDWISVLKFEEPRFAYSTLGMLGGDTAEVLETMHRIKEGDMESWYEEWNRTAERVFKVAEEAEKKGHDVSAGEAYMRASHYYMASEFYTHDDLTKPRAVEQARKSVACFKKAIKLLRVPVEIVSIPYEGTTLPGYLYSSPYAGESAPLLICHTGFDGNVEGMYGTAMAAIERGYHCLAFEGPGQGGMLRDRGMKFRPDWENVMTPIVDYAVTIPGIDPEKIAVLGWSFGGYLAPRAACYEHRPKVYIANGGIYSFYESCMNHIPPELQYLYKTDPKTYNAEVAKAMKHSIMLKWGMQDSLWKIGGDSIAEVMTKLEKFTLEGHVDKIKSHIVVVDSETDVLIQQAHPKTWMLFTVEEAANAHCQSGAKSVSFQRMFDWLDEFFDHSRK